jgi:glycosyltransferase involved in cell wall biosynthesis
MLIFLYRKVAMHENLNNSFPSAMYIATYDICGYNQDTGREKETQKTGIVTHTHQLVEGFSQLHPALEIAISQTGTLQEESYTLVTPEGQTVRLTSINARHPKLDDPATGKVSPAKVAYYYESDVHNPDNPIWVGYATQYAADIYRAGIPDILLQNPNPLVGVLKAEELGYLHPGMSKQLRVTAVLHDTGNDTAGYTRRFEYIRDRLTRTSMDVVFVAISQSTYIYLLEQGIPKESITLIPNGINIERFDKAVSRAKELGTFACLQVRDNLPEDKKLIVSTARRVRWKGHQVIIKAARILQEQGMLADAYIAFAGKDMIDSKSANYTEELATAIQEGGLSDTIFLLDTLRPDELAACYGEAYISLLPSIRPEGIPYSNFEAMLAGVPVITSRLGGPLDYIAHGENGLFVEPNDPFELAHAIGRVLSSSSLHATLAQNGRRTAEEYSFERMVQAYARVITRTKTKEIHRKQA